MAEKIKLVRNDTGPQIIVSLTDKSTGLPIDLSAPSTLVEFKFREAGSSTIKETLTCGKVTGLLNEDGSITTTAPYNVAGAGGRIAINFGSTTLNTSGDYEGEIQITFAGGLIQTVYEVLKFSLREDF